MANLENVRFYVGDKRAFAESLAGISQKSVYEPGIRVVKKAIILPEFRAKGSKKSQPLLGGVVTAAGDFIAGHDVYGYDLPERAQYQGEISDGYSFSHPPVILDETVIWGGGRTLHHFGHTLIELFARLWFAIENPGKYRVAFGMTELPAFSWQLLEAAGLQRSDIIFVDKPTQFDAVIIPDQDIFLKSATSSGVKIKSVFDKMRDSVPPGDKKMVYLSRTNLSHKQVVQLAGESYFEKFYADHGYEIVHPQMLPIPEQIAILAGATHIAMTQGTLAHLTAFCQDGVETTILLRDREPEDNLRPQWVLQNMRHSPTNLVEVQLGGVMPYFHGLPRKRIIYPTTYWQEYVNDYFGESIPRPDKAILAEALLEGLIAYTNEFSERQNWPTLNRTPSPTFYDFISNFASLLGKPIDPVAADRLKFRFGTASDSSLHPAPMGGKVILTGIPQVGETVTATTSDWQCSGKSELSYFFTWTRASDRSVLEQTITRSPVATFTIADSSLVGDRLRVQVVAKGENTDISAEAIAKSDAITS